MQVLAAETAVLMCVALRGIAKFIACCASLGCAVIRVPESTADAAQAITSSFRRASTVSVWSDLPRGVIVGVCNRAIVYSPPRAVGLQNAGLAAARLGTYRH